MSGWTKGTFAMLVRGEKGPKQIQVDGWVNGLLAIDERSNRTFMGDYTRRGKVWCITHVPTGYAMRFVLGSRAVATALADKIEQAADWNFTDPNEAKKLGPVVRAIMEAAPAAFIDSIEAGPPVEAARINAVGE